MQEAQLSEATQTSASRSEGVQVGAVQSARFRPSLDRPSDHLCRFLDRLPDQSADCLIGSPMSLPIA